MLGYYPPSNKRDGRFHRIQVKVKRPGPEGGGAQGLRGAEGRAEEGARGRSHRRARRWRCATLLNSPLQSSGLTLQVQAAPFAGTKDNVAVTVEVQGRYLKFEQKGDSSSNTIEVSMLPLEARGKAQQGRRSEVKLNLKPQTGADAVGDRRPDVAAPVAAAGPLSAARRARARRGGGLTGSVFYDLEVPDFTKEKFAMSGVVLTAATAQVTPTAEARPGAQAAPAGAADDAARVLHDRHAGALRRGLRPHWRRRCRTRVDITTRVVDEPGKEVAQDDRGAQQQGAPERRASPAQAERRLRLQRRRCRWRTSPPGRYLLTGRGQAAHEGRRRGERVRCCSPSWRTPQARPSGGGE